MPPPDNPRRTGEGLFDQLAGQLESARDTLSGDAAEAADRAAARFGESGPAERRILQAMASTAPLADPGGFPAAHRRAVQALEVLDREGSREPPLPHVGPLRPLIRAPIEFVATYIVKAYSSAIARRLSALYMRREAQAEPGTDARRALARARMEMERLTPGFKGGGLVAPALLAGGAVVPIFASVSKLAGGIDFADRWVVVPLIVGLLLLFLGLSAILLRGAALARGRSRLVMEEPLATLWATIGSCGEPPRDHATLFAAVAGALTAAAWFAVPALAAVVVLLR